MKKTLVILSLILTVATATVFALNSEQVKGWFLAGSDPNGYNMGVEKDAARNGNVAFLKSIRPIKGNKFGTIMQTFMADEYLGKRVKLTGYIKSSEVKQWAGMWFRIDGGTTKKNYKMLGFDNMEDRPIKGTTEWKKYEITLDVPPSGVDIAFGVLLCGQ